MASSAGTPGPPSNAPGQGDSNAPPTPTNSSPDTGKSSPPTDNGSGSSNNTKDGGAANNNNNNNRSSQSSSPPPPASPPPSPSSPPPASPPPSKEVGSGNSPPSGKSPPQSSSASPPPSSPPPSSSSSSKSSPPPGSPPPNSPGQSSTPPATGQSSPSPTTGQSSPPPNSPGQASPPPAPGQANPASNTPSTNGTADPGGSKWSPPSQADSPPLPASSTPGGNSPPNSNIQSDPSLNVPSPPTDSKSSPSSESPQGSSRASNSLSSEKTGTTSSGFSSPSTAKSADGETIIGATVASVFVLALLAIFFVMRGRRKKRDAYTSHYMNNYNEKADGYYHGQNYPMNHSGTVDTYYVSQTQPGPLANSFGSQRANGYNSGGGGSDSGVLGGSKSFFTYEELIEITNGFSRENVIGEGGFGCVYKGLLPDGRVVAVKQLKAGSGQGEREFRAEVEIISRVHHRHLVSLVGYCISENNRLLIYEFVPNNNLEHHLHGKGMPVLDWSKRVKIALGSAKGLAYLHEDCHPKIIHRDIKSANILIDDDFEAQVADFGLAKLNDTTQTHVSTRVMGTFGYLAPEYASSGKLTDRSDVFSFGVVLLELITGRKPVDASQPLGDESLVEWARPHLAHALETGDLSELVDPRLEKLYVESEMLGMMEAAAACVRHSGPKRPRMAQVVRALDSEGEMSDLSNGVKYGQSTIYNSGQYNQDIMMFRKMALGFGDSSELSGEYTSRDASRRYSGSYRSLKASNDFTSGESETRPINQNYSQQRWSQGRSGRQF